ncbi:MAG: threonine dehydrogenase-like Zn-dependent dehydrogenase [Limisphaerales bacterium]|jgi:threonine dehydrogenase-like Zn-dependent dehydrogenase|nr:hypothetical protein [Pedosphaera sp.]
MNVALFTGIRELEIHERPKPALERAALVEPLSVGVHAVRLSAMQSGGAVGVLGAGPIGVSVLLAMGALLPKPNLRH